MGTQYLRADLRDDWSEENPTRNYCYVIAEFVYWYLAPDGSTVWQLQLPGEKAPHVFVKDASGNVLDMAAEQFDFDLPYERAREKFFLQTGGKGPSKRAKILATKLGFLAESWKKSLTHSGRESTLTTPTSSKQKGRATMANTVMGNYKGHVLTAEVIESDEGRNGLKIVKWEQDGKPVAQKTAKGIVGTEFKTASKAGHEVYVRMNRDFGYPESTDGRHLKFSAENGSAPKKVKSVKAEKPAKASKRSTKVVAPDETPEDEPDEADEENEAPVTGRAAKKSQTKANRERRQAKANGTKSTKRSKVAKTPSAASYSIISPFNQKNPEASADDPRFWCAACCNAFDPMVDGGSAEECPKGHRTSDFEDLE